MPVEIIGDEALVAPLTRIFEDGGVEDVIFVNAEMAPNRSRLCGLDKALERVAEDRPLIIMTCFDVTSDKLMSDNRFHTLRVCPNVEFVRMPVSAADAVAAVKRIIESPKPADALALALAGIKDPEDLLRVLKHDVAHVVRGEDPQKRVTFLARAWQAGYVGTDEEIIASIQADQPVSTQALAGQSFPDVFCDIEGTLLVDGLINQPVIDFLREQEKIRPITIWTGGYTSMYRQQLAKHLPWKVVSKWVFGSVTVATAIDDESQSSLEARYGFKILEHINVSDLESK